MPLGTLRSFLSIVFGTIPVKMIKGFFLLVFIVAGVTLYQIVENDEIGQIGDKANTMVVWLIDYAFALIEYLSDVLPT